MSTTTKITMEDVKNIFIMFKFESGEVIMVSDKDEDAEIKTRKVGDNIIDDGNKITSIAVKAILNDGNWIKTDGTNVASKNVTDTHFTEYLAKMVNLMKPLYLEALNNNKVYEAMIKMHEMGRELEKLALKYGYHM